MELRVYNNLMFLILTSLVMPVSLIEIFNDLFCFQRDKVEAFVSKVNGAMRVRHELEKLKTTADRIHNNYNVVEAVSEEMEKVGCDQDIFYFKIYNN